MPRIASLFVPLFPLAARLRSEPDLLNEAVVVVEGNGNAARVIAASRRARKEKIRPGMTLPQARAILPKLIARGRDAACERTAQEALLEVAETFSPRVEDGGDGVVYLDVDGMQHHYQDELTMAKAMLLTVEAAGIPARVGIAGSKLAARVAAELPKSPHVVPPGEESLFLAPLPLARLTPEMVAAAALSRWGIDSIGELARLPEAEVASRLGETGRDLHWAARGIDPTPLMPRQLPPDFREGMELEWPLVSLEPFLFIANAALDRLSKRMEAQGFAARRIDLELKLEPDGFDARGIDLPAPTRDVKTMLTLLRLTLEEKPPGAPIAGLTLVAHPDRPRRAQLSLFGPAALSPDRLATAVARLASLLGADRVGMPGTIDCHDPQRFAMAAYDPPPPPEVRKRPKKSRGILALRMLRPPLPLEVVLDGDTIRSIKAEATVETESKQKLKLEGAVRISSGPWRLEEGWWTDAPVTRDYWDLELMGGGVVRVYREGGWYAEAVYD
jgi:protein ImuB